MAVEAAMEQQARGRSGAQAEHDLLTDANPVLEEAKGLTISVYDPTYFIAFELAKTDPAKLSEGAPKGCAAKVGVPAQEQGKGAALEGLQAQLGAFGVSIAKTIMVECNSP